MRLCFRQAAVSGIVLATTGCADAATSPAADSCGRDGVTVTVTPGTRPTFSWQPGCRVASLTVRAQTPEGGDGAAVWVLTDTSSARAGIAPPVVYPETRGGAAFGDADPLVSGQRYRVSLGAVRDGAACLSFLTACPRNAAGETSFVP